MTDTLASEAADEALLDGELFHKKAGRPVDWPRPLAPLADTHGHLTAFWGHDPAHAVARAALAGVRLLVVPLDALTDCIPGAGADPDMEPSDVPAFEPRGAEELLSLLDDAYEGARSLMAVYARAGLVPPSFEGHALPEGTSAGLPLALRFVVGVHPYGAAEYDGGCRERIMRMAQDGRCVGVGEIGLDYTCSVPRDVQLACFRDQLELARGLDLPVELHIRNDYDDTDHEAHADALALLREVGVPSRGCDLHCYTSDAPTLRVFAGMGCHVAFGGAATFKKSDDIREASLACPQHLLLTETDCPYMAPVPLRGKECEPAMVAFTADLLARLRADAGVARPRETYEALWANACVLFGIHEV